MNRIFFSVLTILAFIACKQPEVVLDQYLECYIRHDAATGKTKVEASLHDTKTKVAVEIKNGIKYQKEAMRLSAVAGMSYRYDYAADFIPEHLFEWKSADGKGHTLKLPMNELRNFGFGSEKVSRNKSATLTWDGKPLESGETLVLMWENLKTAETVPVELYSTNATSAKVEFPAAKMRDLSAGDWSLYLVRKKMTKQKGAESEGVGVAEYFSKIDTIRIVE